MKSGKAANTDKKITLARKANTMARWRHSISGRERDKPPAKVTLPRVKWLERPDPS